MDKHGDLDEAFSMVLKCMCPEHNSIQINMLYFFSFFHFGV